MNHSKVFYNNGAAVGVVVEALPCAEAEVHPHPRRVALADSVFGDTIC